MTRTTQIWISILVGVLVLIYLIQAGQERDNRCERHPNSNECLERSIGLDYDM